MEAIKLRGVVYLSVVGDGTSNKTNGSEGTKLHTRILRQRTNTYTTAHTAIYKN